MLDSPAKKNSLEMLDEYFTKRHIDLKVKLPKKSVGLDMLIPVKWGGTKNQTGRTASLDPANPQNQGYLSGPTRRYE